MSQTTLPTEAPKSIDSETFALLTALVVAHLGETAKIRAVRLAPPPGDEEGPLHFWALEGRRSIYASHKVR
ncbi:MAG: hypothetical protein SFV32_00940 [Opitutaceae bacterium]|nr:hypothetical protein [Opitutaceae bacterium]